MTSRALAARLDRGRPSRRGVVRALIGSTLNLTALAVVPAGLAKKAQKHKRKCKKQYRTCRNVELSRYGLGAPCLGQRGRREALAARSSRLAFPPSRRPGITGIPHAMLSSRDTQ